MYKIVNNIIRVNIPEYIARPTRVTRSYQQYVPISTIFLLEL